MKRAPRWVLDSSALLAFLGREDGSARVRSALAQGSAIGIVNWMETLSKIAEHGGDPALVEQDLRARNVSRDSLRIVPLDGRVVVETAALRPLTAAVGLSLGDRACLALGRVLGLPVLTSDDPMTWLDLGIAVEHIRPHRRKPLPRRK